MIALAVLRPSPATWSPDGVLYARAMLADAHRRPDAAFSIQTGSTYFQSPVHRASQERLFTNRILYPWLGSLLYPFRGYQALIDVSRVAYVLAVYIVFALVARFGGVPAASLCAAALAADPLVRSIASSALTDMLALALWSAVLLAVVCAVQQRGWPWTAAFAALTIVLTLNRPMIYYPVLATIAVAVVRRDGVSYRLAIVAALLALAYAVVSKVAGLPGIVEELQWVHYHARELDPTANRSIAAWWRTAFANVALTQTKAAIRLVYPAALLLGAALGIWCKRDRLAFALLAGSLAATAISVAANPVNWSFDRTADLPLTPAVLIGIGLLLGAVMTARSTRLFRVDGPV